jgi:predicted ester cyclase
MSLGDCVSGADNKAIVLRLIEEVMSNGNLAAADELVDPNFVLHLPGSQEPLGGVEGLKRVAESLRAGFPGLRMSVEDVICEGDKVAVRITQQGTHTVSMRPKIRQVNVAAIAIFRVVEGKIVEEWLSSDRLGLLQQIGARSR